MKPAVAHAVARKTGAGALPLLLGLMGCAQVTVHALDENGAATSKPEGLRYYMPKPYLLVMRLPADAGGGATAAPRSGTLPRSTAGKPTVEITPGHPAGQVPDGPPGGASSVKPATDGSTPSASPAATPTASSDLSFSASNGQYVAKLIYLPDLSQPMAISESSGLFGTATMGASLQDGWMLTSLQGSSDAKVADTISALASLVSAVSGAGAPAAAAKTAAAKAPGGPATPSVPGLTAGLYAFNYASGTLVGLCSLTLFETRTEATPPPCPPK